MENKTHVGPDVFESGCDMIDVTSMSRVDPSWKEVDKNGHVHQWYADGKPATVYRPELKYDTPTLVWVVDGIGYYPDGDEYEKGHYECAQCRVRVGSPGTTADMFQQLMPGLRWFQINGESVSAEEFQQRREAAAIAHAAERSQQPVTFERLLRCDNSPVKCADGALGLIVRWYKDAASVGVQVPGEDSIREILVARLRETGAAAFAEITSG